MVLPTVYFYFSLIALLSIFFFFITSDYVDLDITMNDTNYHKYCARYHENKSKHYA